MEEQEKKSSVEIVVVGNELLNGTTLDTNSQWLSKKLLELGALVTRKTTVSDNLFEISDAFRSSIRRSPAWIFSLGGLGPTFDDMTLHGLAKALRKNIERDPEAVRMIRQSRERRLREGVKLSKRIHQSTLKMAEIPSGSTPLQNPVGTAPAVLVRASSSTTVVSLPGVPREMKVIFNKQVSPILKKALPSLVKREKWLLAKGISESSFAPAIQKLMNEYSPVIYIKSHPLNFKNGVSALQFQLSVTSPKGDEKALQILETVTKKLAFNVKKLGGRVSKKNNNA